MNRADGALPDELDGEDPARLLPRALGWVSLAVGLGGLAAPRAVARLTGVDDTAAAQALVPAIGLRELGHAAGLLSGRRPAGWAWSRVAGDAMDLALLSRGSADRCGERRRRVAVTTAVVAGITAVDLFAAMRAGRAERSRSRRIRIEAAITVNRPAAEAYRFWRDFENLPRFMYHLESVRCDDARRSHWTARGPAGRGIEWDAQIVDEQPERMIAWRSMPGARVPNAGRVRFVPAPGWRGTEIRVQLGYAPPGGALGRAVGKLLGEEPEQQVRDDLRRFKQVLETGEVVRSEGSPDGISVRQQLIQRPAQPLPAAARR